MKRFLFLFTSFIMIEIYLYSDLVAWNDSSMQKIQPHFIESVRMMFFYSNQTWKINAYRKLVMLELLRNFLTLIFKSKVWKAFEDITGIKILNFSEKWDKLRQEICSHRQSGTKFSWSNLKSQKNWTQPENVEISFCARLALALLLPIFEIFPIFHNFLSLKSFGSSWGKTYRIFLL